MAKLTTHNVKWSLNPQHTLFNCTQWKRRRHMKTPDFRDVVTKCWLAWYPSRCVVHYEEQITEGRLLNANFHLLDVVSHCSTYSILEYKMFDQSLAQMQFPLKSADFFAATRTTGYSTQDFRGIILVGGLVVSAIREKGEIRGDKGFVRKFLCSHKKLSQIHFNVLGFFFPCCNTCIVKAMLHFKVGAFIFFFSSPITHISFPVFIILPQWGFSFNFVIL